MGARTTAAPIAAAPNAGAMNLIDVFMMLPPIFAGPPNFNDAQIIALLQTGVATADTHSALQLAGIWNFPITMLAAQCPARSRSGLTESQTSPGANDRTPPLPRGEVQAGSSRLWSRPSSPTYVDCQPRHS